jgi:hypothetical protein
MAPSNHRLTKHIKGSEPKDLLLATMAWRIWGESRLFFISKMRDIRDFHRIIFDTLPPHGAPGLMEKLAVPMPRRCGSTNGVTDTGTTVADYDALGIENSPTTVNYEHEYAGVDDPPDTTAESTLDFVRDMARKEIGSICADEVRAIVCSEYQMALDDFFQTPAGYAVLDRAILNALNLRLTSQGQF